MICGHINTNKVPCAFVRPCPLHDGERVRRQSAEEIAREAIQRAFEQSLFDHDANALNAWRARTGEEITALPFPPPLEQEVLFG